jgi:hypothetical protein
MPDVGPGKESMLHCFALPHPAVLIAAVLRMLDFVLNTALAMCRQPVPNPNRAYF